MPTPELLYFDLGKVLVDFDHQQMFRQIADVSGTDATTVSQILTDADLQRRHETGALSTREFYEQFCEMTGTRPALEELSEAVNAIFALRPSMEPVVRHLHATGWRLGILSNTFEGHWLYCREHYPVLAECFSVFALSYELGAMKPDPRIYRAAAELAGVRPEAIFFTDDIAGNVAAARKVGFDAVQYTGTEALVEALRERGVAPS